MLMLSWRRHVLSQQYAPGAGVAAVAVGKDSCGFAGAADCCRCCCWDTAGSGGCAAGGAGGLLLPPLLFAAFGLSTRSAKLGADADLSPTTCPPASQSAF